MIVSRLLVNYSRFICSLRGGLQSCTAAGNDLSFHPAAPLSQRCFLSLKSMSCTVQKLKGNGIKQKQCMARQPGFSSKNN